jgi:type IV pilus assembly protein PilZ
MSVGSDERRGSGRAPIELKVEYRRVNAFFADYTKNISQGGTFIGTTRPLPIGTEFLFSLFVPGMTEPLRLRGKVVWVSPVEGATVANPAGMGTEFQYDSEEERKDKQRIVWKLLALELGEALATRIVGDCACRSDPQADDGNAPR